MVRLFFAYYLFILVYSTCHALLLASSSHIGLVQSLFFLFIVFLRNNDFPKKYMKPNFSVFQLLKLNFHIDPIKEKVLKAEWKVLGPSMFQKKNLSKHLNKSESKKRCSDWYSLYSVYPLVTCYFFKFQLRFWKYRN